MLMTRKNDEIFRCPGGRWGPLNTSTERVGGLDRFDDKMIPLDRTVHAPVHGLQIF